MNKKDLIKYVSDKTLVKQSDLCVIIDVFLDKIKEGFMNGEKITIQNFGSFRPIKRQARKAINPKTQKMIDVPEKKVVKFKLSQNMVNKLNVKEN